MKKIVLAVLVFCSCNSQKDMSKQAADEITAADKACSDMAVKEGFLKALVAYSDDSIIKPKEAELPIIGKKNLSAYYSTKKETKAISWTPFKVEASASGDLGYSAGYWKYVTPDTTMYGNYFTVWKKQKDNTWKFIVDGGNNTPAPK